MKRLRAAVAAAVLVGASTWLWQNASIPRLRAEFVPWMHRLERYRDALEATRAALRVEHAGPRDPAGLGPVRAWAWHGLERVAEVSFDVPEKPRIGRDGARFPLDGRAVFTVDGFRVDGARVERSASVFVLMPDSGSPGFAVRLGPELAERVERSPRFRDATRPSASRTGSSTASGPAAAWRSSTTTATGPRTSSSATASGRSSTATTERGTSPT